MATPLDSAVLVAGELAANAVRHGRRTMVLTLALGPEILLVTVHDHGARPHHDAAGPALGQKTSVAAAPPSSKPWRSGP